ncbi:MAG: T9SS type A sorting domain-containing protein [Bacteroidota bacterium]
MKKLYSLIITFLICSISSYAQPGYINTIAGGGTSGLGDGGLATNAQLNSPRGVAVDNAGNVYIADSYNNRVRKINATTGIITTIAGTGVAGYSGDAGLAINAQLFYPFNLALDATNNLYVSDCLNNRIRKISLSTGIISTVVGTGVGGFSGDGGLAINAQINHPRELCIDKHGDLYFADSSSGRVRKVNMATGNINTYVGNGVANDFDLGVVIPANAETGYNLGLAIDSSDNMFIALGAPHNHGICELFNSTGLVFNICPGTDGGFGGDGGRLSGAIFFYMYGLATDAFNNLYISDIVNNRIRMASPINNVLNHNSIVNTIVGSGIDSYTGFGLAGFSGDGGPATNAHLSNPYQVAVDFLGNIYIADVSNNRIRKVSSTFENHIADSFSVVINPLCSGVEWHIGATHYYPNTSIKTYFGDGQTSLDTFAANNLASINHIYNYPGSYTVKHVLYHGTLAIDSTTYSHDFNFCRTIPIRLYQDLNANCIYDSSTESLNSYPTTIEVDSNGIPKDTFTVLSGIDYNASGTPGDIFQFKILTSNPSYLSSCPASGIITDTLVSGNNPTKYLGFHCSNTAGFDLLEQVNMQTGRHIQTGHIIAYNTYCTPLNSTVTLNFNPQYTFNTAYPVPNSIVGNTLTWNLNNLSATSAVNIDYTLSVPNLGNQSNWLNPGDTVHSTVIINPITGDVNPLNNTCIRIDTVKSSYDPNEMAVSPMPYIQSAGQLQYTIQFENTGNDTAQNISVLDTLSNNLDIHSLAMVASSHSCIFSKTWNGTNWVAKFDFPNIRLLDSSHHNQCNGMLVFNIKTQAGLSAGTTIFNHAAIYFDDNPSVITDTVENIIAIPVTPTVIVTANSPCSGIPVTFTANITNGGSAPIYQWNKNGVNVGTNSNTYTYTPTYGDSVKCYLTSNAILPIPATVSSVTFHVAQPVLDSFIVVNPSTCGGTTGSITLNGVIPNTLYPVSYTKNGVPIGPVNYTSNAFGSLAISGLTAAAYSNIAVTITGGCTTVPINNVYLTNPTPPAAPRVANSTLSICIGDTIHLSASSSLSGAIYSWSGPSFTSAIPNPYIPNSQASNSGLYSVFVTDPVTNCSSNMATTSVTVNSNVTPTVSISANDTLCTGATLLAIASANIASCSYQWHLNTGNVGTNTNTYSYSPTTGDVITCSIIATAPSSCYTATTANSNTLTADVLANVTPTISITGLDTVISGTPTLYTATTNIVGGIYQWKVNGNNVGTNTNTYTYTPLSGDVVTCAITVPSVGCFTASNASSNSLHIVIINLGIANALGTNTLSIYPNPAHNVLNINNLKESANYRLLSVVGTTVQHGILSSASNSITTEALPVGMYMLELVYSSGEKQVIRIVKE